MLFTDLVGSTELSVAFGTVYDEVRRAHDALLRSAVDAHGGTVVKGTGDGLMATFPVVVDGVDCAAGRAGRHPPPQPAPAGPLAVDPGRAVGR